MRLLVSLLTVVQCFLVALLNVLMSSLGLLLTAQPFFLGRRKMFSISSRVFPFVSGTKKRAKAETAEMNMEKIQKVQSCPSAATIGLKNRVTTKAIVQLKQAEERCNMLCFVQE